LHLFDDLDRVRRKHESLQMRDHVFTACQLRRSHSKDLCSVPMNSLSSCNLAFECERNVGGMCRMRNIDQSRHNRPRARAGILGSRAPQGKLQVCPRGSFGVSKSRDSLT
jgi:hypothetical protein